MKRLLTLACLALGLLTAEAQQSMNMSKLDSWRDTVPGRYYNDCWGYAANGREYAILGSNWGTHFLDVTDPNNIVEVQSFAGTDTDVVWRDFKTNGHYAYGVADGGNNSLQIFDLSGLPATVTKVYDSQVLTRSTHNLFIENNRLYLCATTNGGPNRAIDIVSIADPENPQFLNSIPGLPNSLSSAVHDAYVRNDTAYLSGEYPGLYIYNLADPMNPQLISSITAYPDQGYNHSSWTTADAKTIVFADEVPAGLPLKIYDISNIQNPVFKSTFQSNPGATPHNPYVVGNHVIISYYKDGVQVYDISDRSNPVRVGYYDTYPDNTDYAGNPYEGCWGVYPFLPSGRIIASDITYGLFTLTNPYSVSAAPEQLASAGLQVYPNPAKGNFNVQMPATGATADFSLINTLGQEIKLTSAAGKNGVFSFSTDGLASGFYTVQAKTNGVTYSSKLIIK